MLKASELRINNLIIWEGEEYKVEASFFDQYRDEDIEPIPLTKEWLVKFGFRSESEVQKIEFNHDGEICDQLVFNINNDKHVSLKNWKGESMDCWYISNHEIKHVHQLQNLYFALTGEELKIIQG